MWSSATTPPTAVSTPILRPHTLAHAKHCWPLVYIFSHDKEIPRKVTFTFISNKFYTLKPQQEKNCNINRFLEEKNNRSNFQTLVFFTFPVTPNNQIFVQFLYFRISTQIFSAWQEIGVDSVDMSLSIIETFMYMYHFGLLTDTVSNVVLLILNMSLTDTS